MNKTKKNILGYRRNNNKKNRKLKHAKKNTKSSVMISVIVPTYDRPDMLLETLKSILNQTYQNFEIIVVNDAGMDVKDKINMLNKNNNIFYLSHQSNKGLAAARNTGIKEARGKYIAYLDDDDVYYPDHIETLVNFLKNSEYKVAYTDAYRAHQQKISGKYVTVKKDLPYSFDFNYDHILIENFIPVLCLMHEKSCLREVGLFDENLTVLEDWDLWIRMSRKFKFAHIKKVTSEFSWKVDGSTLTSKRQSDFYRTIKVIYEKYKRYFKDKPYIVEEQRDTILGHILHLLDIVEEKNKIIHSIYSSKTWKAGKIITAPIRGLKGLLRINGRI